jgi:hypothetical protein
MIGCYCSKLSAGIDRIENSNASVLLFLNVCHVVVVLRNISNGPESCKTVVVDIIIQVISSARQ